MRRPQWIVIRVIGGFSVLQGLLPSFSFLLRTGPQVASSVWYIGTKVSSERRSHRGWPGDENEGRRHEIRDLAVLFLELARKHVGRGSFSANEKGAGTDISRQT